MLLIQNEKVYSYLVMILGSDVPQIIDFKVNYLASLVKINDTNLVDNEVVDII